MLPLQYIIRLLVMLRHTTVMTHYNYIDMLVHTLVHLVKLFFIYIAHVCEIIYKNTATSPVPVTKRKHTVNKS